MTPEEATAAERAMKEPQPVQGLFDVSPQTIINIAEKMSESDKDRFIAIFGQAIIRYIGNHQ